MNNTNHTLLRKFAQTLTAAVRGLLPFRDLAQDSVPFGHLIFQPAHETRHIQLIGNAGTGKSMAIEHLLAGIAQRPSQRAVLVDPDGRYARLFYCPERGDRILNPFDARDVGWDIAAEITQPFHAAALAAALVPSGEAAAWSHYGQQLVSATITALKRRGDLTVETLYQTLTTTPPEEYAKLVADSPAAVFFRPDNEKMRGRIESVVVNAVAGLRCMNNGSLSLSQYAQGEDKGWVFLTYKAEQVAALKNIIATMMRVVIFELMSRPEGDSGTWFVIDDLDSLGKIAGLQEALQRLRKFGGRCVLTVQSVGALADIYDQFGSQALLESCASTLLLRSSFSEAARVVGALWLREVSLSQIEQLEDLQGYVHPYGSPWSHCTIEPYIAAPIAEAFVPRAPESEAA